MDQFSNRASAVAANLRRVLRLGTVDAVVSNEDLALPAVLSEFRRQFPSVTMDYSTGNPEELERQLISGNRDVIVVPSRGRLAKLDYIPILEEKQSLYCARLHPLFGTSRRRDEG